MVHGDPLRRKAAEGLRRAGGLLRFGEARAAFEQLSKPPSLSTIKQAFALVDRRRRRSPPRQR
jgi:hypothetical protein